MDVLAVDPSVHLANACTDRRPLEFALCDAKHRQYGPDARDVQINGFHVGGATFERL